MANGGPMPRGMTAAYLGRNQGPELFFVSPFAALQQTVIPKTLSMNRPLEAILVRWSGRVVIGVANYTAVAAEAPQTIINRFRVTGTYKGAALTPIDLSGATAFAYQRIFQRGGNSLNIGGVRQADPGIPFAQLGATFGDVGTYDLDIWYLLPMWPIVPVANRARDIVPFCWQPRDWNDTIQIQLDYGDLSSFGTPGGTTTVAFTAFGSGAGTPSVRIYTRYLILGPLRTGFRSACVVRGEQAITQGVAAIANQVRLAVLQKQKTTAIILKSGINLTGTSAGVQVFASLADTLLDVTQPMVDNRPMRNNQDNLTFKEHMMDQYQTVVPGGYFPIGFTDSGTARSAFRADLPSVVAPGAQFELLSNIATANANNRVNMVQEQIYADADDPAWANTR